MRQDVRMTWHKRCFGVFALEDMIARDYEQTPGTIANTGDDSVKP